MSSVLLGKRRQLQCQIDVMMTITKEGLQEIHREDPLRGEVAITTTITMMIGDLQDPPVAEAQDQEEAQNTIQIEEKVQEDHLPDPSQVLGKEVREKRAVS